MATRTPFEIISHTRRVCSLYKRSLRALQDHCIDRALFRYNAAFMRQRFEENRKLKDMEVANQLVEAGEEELFWKKSPFPFQFPHSPGGSAYQRVVIPPDNILDFWDPVEKAFYPEYFKRREQRKKEYIANWEKEYGKVDISQYKHDH